MNLPGGDGRGCAIRCIIIAQRAALLLPQPDSLRKWNIRRPSIVSSKQMGLKRSRDKLLHILVRHVARMDFPVLGGRDRIYVSLLAENKLNGWFKHTLSRDFLHLARKHNCTSTHREGIFSRFLLLQPATRPAAVQALLQLSITVTPVSTPSTPTSLHY